MLERQETASCTAALADGANGICGWLLHCKSLLVILRLPVSTVVCPACLRGDISTTGLDEFRKRGSNRVYDL